MTKAIPVIHASAEELKPLRAQQRHPAKHQRLHARYLLARGHARFRTHVARLLGVDRTTVGRWLDRYAQGGLAALLELYVPPGKAPAVQPDQVAQLQQALAHPHRVGSYAEARQWIQDTFGGALTDTATHTLVHYQLGAKRNVARPAHIKQP